MARHPTITVPDLTRLAQRCEDLGLDIHAMCDRAERSFHIAELREIATARLTQQINAVALAAALLNSKLIAMRAMEEDARDLERRIRSEQLKTLDRMKTRKPAPPEGDVFMGITD